MAGSAPGRSSSASELHFLDETQGEIDKIEGDPGSLFTDTSSFEKANKLARAYGLDECADDN